MSEDLELIFENLKLGDSEEMNTEQVRELIMAEVNRALSLQKLEFDKKLTTIQSQFTLAQPKVEKFAKVRINPLVTCDITLDAIKSLPEFSGQPGTYVSWREAAHNAYELFQRYDGSERHYQAVIILRNKVRGTADAVLSSFNTVLNFKAIIARLDFTYADKRPIYLIEQELSTLRQGSMSLLEFYDEVEKKLTLLSNKTVMSYEDSVADTINEKYRADALRVFISGLRKPLCDILFASRPSDLPTALALAQEVDANNERYAFAKNFANRSNKTSYGERTNSAQNSSNTDNNGNYKNPHYSTNKQKQTSQSENLTNFQKPHSSGSYPDRGRVEPMEVDPSMSRFRQPTNAQNYGHNNRPQGNPPKRTANSGRYTGPKMQRVNHLDDEQEQEALNEPTYEEDAEQAVDDIEDNEINFLGQGLSCPGFKDQ